MADGAHVFGNHVAAAADEGVGAGGLGQRDRGTGRSAVGDQRLQLLEVVFGRFTRGEDDVDDVFLDLLVHVDVLHHAARLDDVFGCDHLVRRGKPFAREVHPHDVALLLLRGVGDFGFEHESVDLRFGQRVGSLLFEGVLRGQHQEGLGQLVGVVADGHLALLHRFEQRRLHLRRRAVDLVGQYEVGEDGAFAHHELLALLRVDERTDQVGRQQVGRELDAGEIGVDGLCERRNRQRLGKTRHAFQEDVAVRQQTDQQRVDQMGLTDDHLAHLGAQRVDEDRLPLDAFVEFLDIDDFTHGCYVFLDVIAVLFFNE